MLETAAIINRVGQSAATEHSMQSGTDDAQEQHHFGDAGDKQLREQLGPNRYARAIAEERYQRGCRPRLLDFVEAHPRDYEPLYGYGYRERMMANVQEAEFTMFEG